MAETSGLRQFLILLYKGLLLRKRHYIVTFFEIVIPILIASIPAIIQSELSSPHQEYDQTGITDRALWENYTTYKPFDSYYTERSTFYHLHFVFTPPNELTRRFMNDSIELFRNSTSYRGNITSMPARNEKELESYCLSKQIDDPDLFLIGTIFDNFNDKLPDSLDYVIRYSGGIYGTTFATQLKYRVNGPQRSNPYTNSFFLAWQNSVEEKFIHQKMEEKGTSLDYKIWMQRFPYPDHRDSSQTFTVINIVPWVIGYGYLIFIINIVRRIIEEKSNGSKELLKMMGMTDYVYWISTFLNYFIVAVITMFIITIVYKAPLKNSFVFMKHMDAVLLFFLLVLFMASLILFCMAISIFFNKPVYAVIVLLVVYLTSFSLLMVNFFLIDTELNYLPLSLGKKLGICLLPSGSLLTMFLLIGYYETSGDGVHWNNLTEFSLVPDLNMMMVLGTMFFSCVLYIFIIWYFDAVWPWQPGVPKPFYFMFTRSYWCGPKPKDNDELQLMSKNENSSDFFEEEPNSTTPGVIIRNLSKKFRTGLQNKLAVNKVSLNIYQGQITALLGHNGAGKTTTINILTGLYTPTSGTASINGLDILTDTIKARRGLGVCPQHNVLYDTLTADEHLRIYAAMKGVKWSNLNSEATHILNILKLTDKRYELVKNLSGGMKRKLSLGIAIIGGSKVLFLDEPTSGMDVEARRSVWDALLSLRHDRTVILTTHYMEEADILGDRIAIMAEGEVQCCGSPIFLKQKFGTGYHLHVVKGANFNLNELTTLLKKYVPEVSLGKEMEREISFRLSTDADSSFGDMFEEVEGRKVEIGVISYGMTITTMEDVFLNVSNISDIKYKLQSGKEQKNGFNLDMEDVYGDSGRPKARRDLGNQFLGLLLKRFHYAKRHWSIVAAQLVLPFILLSLALHFLNTTGSQYKMTYDPLKLDLNHVYEDTDGFYFDKNGEFQELSIGFKKVLESNNVNVKDVPEPTQYVLNYGKKYISRYLKNLLVGGAFDKFSNETWNLTAWYNGEPYHVLPMSLLLMHTAVLKKVTGTGSISLTNAPLPQVDTRNRGGDISSLTQKIMAVIFFPMALSFLSASFTMVPIHERASKAKLLQMMSGIPAAMYWIAMFLWDFLVHCVVTITLIIPFAIFSHTVFFSPHSEAIGTAMLIMLLYGWASIPFSYLLSFVFKKPNTGFSAIQGICAIFGVGLGSTLMTLQTTASPEEIKEVEILIWVFRILPTFSLGMGAANLFGISYSNAFCETISKEDLAFNCESPLMSDTNPMFKCCKSICHDECLEEVYPITLDRNGCGRDLLFLLLDGIVYFSLLLLLETRFMSELGRNIKHFILKIRKSVVGQVNHDTIVEDSDVLKEEERIRNMHATTPGATDEALMVVDLTKVFRNFYAVDHLAFGIHQEECFGLLGVNGAGKTTTFGMLTGDCYPNEGNALIQNVSLRSNMKKFQSYLGYCPQFDALIDRLSGREMLHLFARLRGLSGSELEVRVNKLIKMTDLTVHADKQTQFYSGGNKRKLSVAIALIGSPPLILLDEPTAGVDPVSRRKIWNILSQARNNTGAAVLLTTHSMEESEALCSRLAIMVNGRFRCLGSIQQLKSKYGQGYTLIIKMKREEQSDYRVISEIKAHIQSSLKGAELKDDHQGMLQYHIVDPSVTLSRLFKFMSQMKNQFDLEDYLISDTSLEQIFLTFARSQRLAA